MDAVLKPVEGCRVLPNLSLSPVFRREWPSLYKVLERSELPRQSLMELYVEHLPETERVILAGGPYGVASAVGQHLAGAHPRTPAVPQSGRAPPVTVGPG